MCRAALAVAAVLCLAAPVEAPRVVDGDTLRLGRERVRLWGIDAPEQAQVCEAPARPVACGRRAMQALAALLVTGPLVCRARDRDRYGRTVARCTIGGRDLGHALVLSGHALDVPRYSKGAYARAQELARAAGRGLWAGPFIHPRDWRRSRRKAPAGRRRRSAPA